MQTLGAPTALPRGDRPVVLTLELGGAADAAVTAERELRAHAARDRDSCCGYFPALSGAPGILGELPACREFARRLPTIEHCGIRHGFNFLRLSLVRQSATAAYHLDSDAATAITGDAATLERRLVTRLLLNLSSRSPRILHYLDVDPRSVALEVDGSYVRVAQPRHLPPSRAPRRSRHGAVRGCTAPCSPRTACCTQASTAPAATTSQPTGPRSTSERARDGGSKAPSTISRSSICAATPRFL